MLSGTELSARLRALAIPQVGIEYIRRVRASPPSRNVSSTGKRNTTWRYASQKMGCTIQAESTLERNFLVRCEYMETVAEFWDQPEAVSVTFEGKGGRIQRVSYTADVLAIESTGITAYQIKPRSECNRLIEQRPARWSRTDNGYEDRSANEAFSHLGITHRVVTEDDISPLAAENYSLLLQARQACGAIDQEQGFQVLTMLSEAGVMTMSSVLRKLGIAQSTTLLRLIDDGKVIALLDKHRLADLEDALIGLDKSKLEEVNETRLQVIEASRMEGTPHTEAPSLDQVKAMVFRLGQLKTPEEAAVSPRTLRRWRVALQNAHGDVRSLVPQTHRRGNRYRRIDAGDINLMRRAIEDYLLVPNPRKITAAYYAYANMRAQENAQVEASFAKPPSLPTFFAEVNRIPLVNRCRAQGGSRLANTVEPPTDPTDRSLSPIRPFERAHIDHYLIDQHVVVLRSSKKKILTKRAWLTVMIDQATHAVLAMSISFRSPSRHACSCVIRDCVRRHGRLPEIIVVDHGSEFESVYFEALLARYGVTKHERPPHDPRFGGPIESTFHSIREEMIRSLPGSTSNDERGRAISTSHRGQSLACWRLHEVYDAYEIYFFQHFNLKMRGTSISSSDIEFNELMATFPFSGMSVDYCEAFLIATAIPLDRKFTVTHSRGITHHGRWYFHPALVQVDNGAKVDVLEDPWDHYRIYASVNHKWVTCLSGTGHSANSSPELRMFRSIEFLENQSERRDEAAERRIAFERELSRIRDANPTQPPSDTEAKPGNSTGTRRLTLPPPPVPEPASSSTGKRKGLPLPGTDAPRPTPFLTHEGSLDGRSINRK